MKLEELCAAVQDGKDYSERFTRREYTAAFREYTERFGPAYMDAVREAAQTADGLRTLAEQITGALEAGWKRRPALEPDHGPGPGEADDRDVPVPHAGGT